MPEPLSRRGNVITEAAFEAPFTTPTFPFGTGGLRLDAALDAIPMGQYSRLTNAWYSAQNPGAITTRPGMTSLATLAGNHHSVVRLADPTTSTVTRVWGVGTSLAVGFSGALTVVDTGYSGDPLGLLTHRPPISSSPWVFVGDTARNRKVRADGLDLPIGLPAPTNAAGAGLNPTLNSVEVIKWTTTMAPAAWTSNPGATYEDPPKITAKGFVSGSPNPDLTTGGAFTTALMPTGSGLIVEAPYYNFWGCPTTLNLNQLATSVASDEDFFHLWLNFSHTDSIEEFRIYLVCSAVFSASILPGIPNAATANTDFYVKSFGANDFAHFIQTTQTQLAASETARVHSVRDDALRAKSREWTARIDKSQLPTGLQRTKATVDPGITVTPQAGAGSDQFVEFGIVGVPLRRSDFQRIGATTGRDWGTITGVICFIRTFPKSAQVAVRMGGFYLHGGSGPDSAEPGNTPYDYRYTHYDTRTAAEGNPSPEMASTFYLDSLRRTILVAVGSYGDSAVRQRIYRRGGTLFDDWYFVGQNASDGGLYADFRSDAQIAAAGTVHLDHYQPVATVSASGNTILAQPVAVYFGPYNGQIFAVGDPFRPGFVYASLPEEPEHWPPDLAHEVCAPSEELLTGFLYGGQPYVFSREGLYAVYPNLTGSAGMSSTPTQCRRGPINRWAWAVGAGTIWFRANDGIFRTTGGAEERVSADLQPLFDGEAAYGYQPPDPTAATPERMAVFDNELWWLYTDTDGIHQAFILQIATGQWRHYTFGTDLSAVTLDAGNPIETLILGGLDAGASYTHVGLTDNGAGIPVTIATGAIHFGQPREEKLFGDQYLDLDGGGTDLTLQNALNLGTVVNAAQGLSGVGAGARAIFDSFGIIPQRARDIQTTITWVSTNGGPTLRRLGTSVTSQPDLTINRVTNWDDLSHGDEAYLMGVTFDADTGGGDRTIIIERDWAGAISTVATLTINHAGRHKKKYSWSALPANQVRIRPEDDCAAWILYRADWISVPEPPRIARWDIHFENAWDQYLTGLDLYCDTANQTKRIVVEVDGTALVDPATGFAFWDISTMGRRTVHLTLPWLRGHVLRFYATDDNPGLLYDHRWHTEVEPSEQANWNQPFTILGTQADKYLKAVIFEVDTFGADKAVRVEADGSTVTTLTVNADGRKVVQIAIPQALGRVWRFFPSDAFPSRLYSLRPVFDEEPFHLDRWETQVLNHGHAEFQVLVEAQVTLKSAAQVILRVTTYVNQTGTIVTDDYLIPTTTGVKLTRYVPFVARKGVLFKYLFTSNEPFWLYGAESHVVGELWVGGQTFRAQPFGDDDADPSRPMVNSTLAAARSGGVA